MDAEWTLLVQLIHNKEELSDFHSTVVTQLCNEQIVHQLQNKHESKSKTDELNTLWGNVISIYLKGVDSILSGEDPEAYSTMIEEMTDQPRGVK